MKIRSGHIPVDIVYIFGAPVRVTRRWDESDQSEDELIYTEVTPAFVSDADNLKTIETGMRWASSMCGKWNPATHQVEVTGTVQKIKKENQPISGIKVMGLEHRGDGGRAYKVLTPDGFYFDLREDVLLDAMLACGIQPKGVLSGEFQWARVGTEMKLVRVGSQLHTALLEASERSILASIPKTKFEVGKIYESKQGERGVFLGYITTEAWKLDWPNGRSTFSNSYMNTSEKPTLTAKKLNRHMLWFDVAYWSLKDKKIDPTPQLLKNALASTELNYCFKLRGTHRVICEIGSVELPEDVVEQVRQKALVTYQKKIHEIWSKQQAKKLFSPLRQNYELESSVASASAILLMRNQGAPKPEVQEPNFLRLEQLIGKQIA
jgi:hypothetical protein